MRVLRSCVSGGILLFLLSGFSTPLRAQDPAEAVVLPQAEKETQTSKNPRQSLRLIPVIRSTPPKYLVGYLGQTLSMAFRVQVSRNARAATHMAWIVNGKVLCKGLTCSLPLDGKALTPGVHSLVFMVYNVYGSVFSHHFVKVLPSAWDPNMPFPNDKMVPIAQEPHLIKAKQYDRKLLHASMKAGFAVQAYPGGAVVLGFTPRNLHWGGTVHMAPGAIGHVVGERGSDWFFLGLQKASMTEDTSTAPISRAVNMEQGRIRVRIQTLRDAVAFHQSVSTPELRARVGPGMDTYIVREKVPDGDNLWRTRVVAISGRTAVLIQPPGQQAATDFELPPGLELQVFSDGRIPPLQKPGGEEIAKLFAETFSVSDLQKRSLAAAPKETEDIDAVVARAKKLAEEEDYFELLATLAPVENLSQKYKEIPYLLGYAYKGLYQEEDAQKYFEMATKVDEKSPEAPWQLGIMHMERARWTSAEAALDTARERMLTGDARMAEYEYYSGVIAFNLRSNFWARDRFMRAAMWEKDLDATLRSSAGGFLTKLNQNKPWSVVVPFGVQWDNNPLSLLSSDPLPAGYSSRSLTRLLAGSVVGWDPGAATQALGWSSAYSGTAIAAVHMPRDYKGFDLVSLSFDATQTNRYEVEVPAPAPTPVPDKPEGAGEEGEEGEEAPPPPLPPGPSKAIESLRIGESLALVVVGGKATTLSISAKGDYRGYSTLLGIDYDLATRSAGSASVLDAFVFQPGWSGAVITTETAGQMSLATSLSAKFALEKSDSFGHSIALSVDPAWQWFFAMTRGNVRGALTLDGSRDFSANRKLSLSATPGASVSWFVAPWMLANLSVTYATTYEDTVAESKVFNKTSASLMMTGLF